MQSAEIADMIGCLSLVQDNTRDDVIADVGAQAASGGSAYQFLPDGSRVYRVRFDVHEYSPEELSVSTSGGQLMVSARQAASSDSRQRRRQMTKTVDLPDDVDIDRLVSTLGNDGMLTVQAPAEPPTYQAVTRSRDCGRPPTEAVTHHVEHTGRSRAAIPRSSSTDQHLQPGTHIVNTGPSACPSVCPSASFTYSFSDTRFICGSLPFVLYATCPVLIYHKSSII